MDLLYSDGAMRHTAKSNMLNENEMNKYSLPSLMGNPDLGATVTDFMAILQSIDYSKFERFSNVADEISTKLLSSFLKCEVLVGVTDGYDFEFSIEVAERKHGTEDSTHMQEIEIIDNQNFQSHFKVALEIRTAKPGETTFRKMERNIAQSFNLLSNQLFGISWRRNISPNKPKN